MTPMGRRRFSIDEAIFANSSLSFNIFVKPDIVNLLNAVLHPKSFAVGVRASGVIIVYIIVYVKCESQ